MINKNILIAILARDCNTSLLKNIPKVERLRSHFYESRVVVVENDSKDGTKETLQKWASESQNVELIMNDFGTLTIPQATANCPHPPTSLHRIGKMAAYRNLYMEYARSLSDQIDYLIVIDIDVKGFSVEGIIDAINKAPKNWGGLFANGRRFFCGYFPYFFDLYAYVSLESKAAVARKSDELFYESKKMTKQMKTMKFVECLSGFGGIAIYKWDAVMDLKYEVRHNDRSKMFEAMCEHVPFNLCLIDKSYHNYVCQSIDVNYGKRSLYHFLTYTVLPTRVYVWLYKLLKGKPYED